jgi:hypothetical protein
MPSRWKRSNVILAWWPKRLEATSARLLKVTLLFGMSYKNTVLRFVTSSKKCGPLRLLFPQLDQRIHTLETDLTALKARMDRLETSRA